MEIFIILILLVLNGLFSMSEIALVSARKVRLKNEADRGDSRAKTALKLAENPDNFLSTVQVGITLIGILTGMYSGETLGKQLEEALNATGNETIQGMSKTLSTIILVTIITYLSLVVGELVPKRLGLTNPEGISKAVAMPMNLLQKVVYPFIWVLSKSSQLLLNILHIKTGNDSQVTEEEIKAILQQGAETGIVDEIEQDIVRRAFFLGDVKISSLMTYRSDIIWVDITRNFEANINKLKSESHSVYPVCDGELDKIVGMVHVKDLYLKEIDNFTQDNLKEVIKEPLIILENMDAYQVLEVFKSHRKHQAVVVDEFGVVVGLVTLNDILEALVGDISDSPHEEYQLVDRGNDTYLVDGQYSFYDFATYFELEYGDFSEESFKTVAGFILHHLRHIPKEGEKFVWEQFTFEIMDMDGNKVDKLLVTVKEQAKNAD